MPYPVSCVVVKQIRRHPTRYLYGARIVVVRVAVRVHIAEVVVVVIRRTLPPSRSGHESEKLQPTAESVAELASEVVDNAEKANSIYPSDETRKELRQ